MAHAAVRIALEPHRRRQLGEDGLVVLWRDGPDPGAREGLACTLSMCPTAGCAGRLVHVDGFVIDAPALSAWRDHDGVHVERSEGGNTSRVTLERQVVAMVDPNSGETGAHPRLPDATDPALLAWLASEMDGDMLEVLHRFRAKAEGSRPEGPARDIDLDAVEELHLVSVEELLEGTRSDEYVLGDRRYYVGMFLCPMPGCDCHEAQLVFFDDEAELDHDVGAVLLDIGGAGGFEIEQMTTGSGPEQPLADLWALFAQRHDVARFLRRREAQLKNVGATLWHPVAPEHVDEAATRDPVEAAAREIATPAGRERFRSMGQAAIAPLLAVLQDGRFAGTDSADGGWGAINAAALLCEIGGTEAVEPLLDLLCASSLEDDDEPHSTLVRGMGKLGDAVLEPALGRLATADSETERMSLLEMLVWAEHRDDRVYDALLQMLREPGSRVDFAAGMLGLHGDPRALDALSRAFDAFELQPEQLLSRMALREIGWAITTLDGTLSPRQQTKLRLAQESVARREQQGRRSPLKAVRAARRAHTRSAPNGASTHGAPPGRNQPCWCGSGSKYKKCHLNSDEAGR